MFQPSLESKTVAEWAATRQLLLERGFVCLEEFLSRTGVEALEVEIERLIVESQPGQSHFTMRDDTLSVILMNRIDKESDVLYDLARHPIMIGIASELLGKPAVSLHVEYFAKPPGSLRSTPPHQDHVFYVEHFEDEMALSFWLALDDVTAASGALEYATPCARELLPHIPSSAPDFDFELPYVDDLEFTVAVVPRGGCVLHHSYVIHRSGVNQTERPRRALVFNYRGSPYRAWLRAEN